MKHSKYQKEIGATESYTKIMVEATNGIGKKYIKGGKKGFSLLIVGLPPRRWMNLQWKLMPS